MCNSRALIVALFAVVALVSCEVPENAIVRESEPLVESLAQSPTEPHDKTDAPNSVTTTDDDEIVAHAGPNNNHDQVECAEGEVLCSNGACAIDCGEETLPLPNTGFQYTFQPNPTQLSTPPAVAGREEDYQSEAANYRDSETDAQRLAVVAAEQSAGLGFASHDAALTEQTQRNAAMKLKVEKLMNTAAAHAADFKAKSAAHDVAIANVKASQIDEKKQEAVVATAEATLKQEKDNLHKAKEHVTAMENEEQNRRYQAEFSGQQYEHAKAEAIKADNKMQEQIHETEEKDKFRKVARLAVEKAAKAELKSVQEKQVAPTEKEKETGGEYHDCKTLPNVYTNAGGKCSDCPAWAKRGNCKDAQYAKFMKQYCSKSCKDAGADLGPGKPANAQLAEVSASMPKTL